MSARDDLPITEDIVVDLNVPQLAFLQLKRKFRAFVAGFGTGKTFIGCVAIIEHFLEHPRIDQGYFAPTFPHIGDIFYPTIAEVAELHGMRVKINESKREVRLYRGRYYYGKVICRSMEHPDRIVGFKIGHALIDELDIMKMDKARRAWRKIIARMRYNVPGVLNGIDVTTTPEGFKFTYEQFVEQVRRKPEVAALYGMVQASTYDNAANLPDDYIPSLLASYPPALIDAYLQGKFVNLTTGNVYPSFNRVRNGTRNFILPGEYLHIGMDFNVGKMAAVVHVIRSGKPQALDEFCELLDTPAMIEAIQEKYPKRNISVYPDASGQNRSTKGASETDLSLLRAAGFNVVVNSTNPRVRDRIICMNKQFADGGYLVNVDRCPTYTEALEKQAYKKLANSEEFEPDKSGGFDHPNDAAGYFINKQFPIVHNRVAKIGITGQ
jgi:hypothetical protein